MRGGASGRHGGIGVIYREELDDVTDAIITMHVGTQFLEGSKDGSGTPPPK